MSVVSKEYMSSPLLSGVNLVVYKKKWDQKRGKHTKIPYDPKDAKKGEFKKARPNDLTTCGDYSDCVLALATGDYDGIGITLSKSDPYVCVDLDNCYHDGKLSEFAQEIVNKFPNAYVELSPSKTGIHLWMKGVLPNAGNVQKPQIEIYDALHYMTLTFDKLHGDPSDLPQGGDALKTLYWDYKGDTKPKEKAENVVGFPMYKSAQVMELVDSFLACGEKCIKAWDHIGASDSQSEWDQVIANLAYARNFKDEEIANLIIANRQQHGADVKKALSRPDYIRRTIEKAHEVKVRDKEEEPVNTDNVYPVVKATNLVMQPQPIHWLVSTVFMARAINWLFGMPSSCKSFLALNVAMHVALGRDWCGYHVEKRHVLYVAGEGEQGINSRLAVLYDQLGIPRDKMIDEFDLILMPVLIDDPLGLAKFINTLKTHNLEDALVVFDTKQMNMLGSDSDPKDVNRFILNLRQLQTAYNCTFLIVDHVSYADPDRMRGCSQQAGAAESSYSVKISEDRTQIKMTVQKPPKDGPPIDPQVFDVVTGELEDAWSSYPGHIPTSLIVEPTDAVFKDDIDDDIDDCIEAAMNTGELILKKLNELYREQQANAGGNHRVIVRVQRKDLRTRCNVLGVKDNTFNKALGKLADDGLVELSKVYVVPL